ncbi:MAG: HigA family addiction module antitoxin [Gemmatimonadota bacterium]
MVDPIPPHPGDILQQEFLNPHDMTQTELARRLEVPFQRVNQIINRRRAITPDTALRLARLFETTPEFWLDLQKRWELHEAQREEAREIERIRPVATRAKLAPAVVRERDVAMAAPGIMDEIVERLVDAIDPEMIVLFGSSASGEAGPASDVDLLVVDRQPFGPHRSRRGQLRRARRALSGMRIAKDLLLYSVDEFERWRRSPNHIVGRALRQGRVLYERP